MLVAGSIAFGCNAADALPPAPAEPDPLFTSASDTPGAVGFSVKETANLKLAASPVPGELLLTGVGSAAGDPQRVAFVTITRFVAEDEPVDLAAVSKRHLAQSPDVSVPRIFRESELEIAGLPAYEIFASATTAQGVPVMLYQALVSDGNHVFRIRGRVGASDQDAYLVQFRSIAASFTWTR